MPSSPRTLQLGRATSSTVTSRLGISVFAVMVLFSQLIGVNGAGASEAITFILAIVAGIMFFMNKGKMFGFIAAGMTAFYMMRLVVLTFFGENRVF